ncbi:MAG: GtrA family protein [Paludibacteraceae bacterium]|nr:GtrA family protein [Paludibacteraceae bacterium]
MQQIAQFITKIIHFFYRPFQRFVPEQLFRYAVCGSANLVLDWVLYFLVYNYVFGAGIYAEHNLIYIQLPNLFYLPDTFCITPHIASLCVVFPITLFTGFWLNRYVTFIGSTLRGRKQLTRYILVVALNLLINYVGLKLTVEHLGWYPTPSKILITLVTVVISFFAQKYYSFRK